MNSLRTIDVHPTWNGDMFAAAADDWDRLQNCAVELRCDSPADAAKIFELANAAVPRNFAIVVLAELAEVDVTPPFILEKLLEIGDQACLESVCLRADLTAKLRAQCDLLRDEKRIVHSRRME